MKSNSSSSYNECDKQVDDRELLKRRWDDERLRTIFSGVENTATPPVMMSLLSATPTNDYLNSRTRVGGAGGGLGFVVDHKDDVVVLNSTTSMMTTPPAVTVVLEGRSICQRISLHKHASYQSLAKALRQMFVVDDDTYSSTSSTTSDNAADLHLSNAIPGYLIAYEDMENDLLLAGDLNWNDFVRIAKRIRILPAKTISRKGKVAARA